MSQTFQLFAQRSFIVIDFCGFPCYFTKFSGITNFFYFINTVAIYNSGATHDFIGRISRIPVKLNRIGGFVHYRFSG